MTKQDSKTEQKLPVAVTVSRAGAIRAKPADVLKAPGVQRQLDSIAKIRLAVAAGN